MTLEIHNLQTFIDLDLDIIVRAIEMAADEKDPDISVSIVDDPTIHQVNLKHLNHDYPTDVISFDYNEGEKNKKLSGEIIVSAQTACACAKENNLSPREELILYLIHGTLHLKGMDDQDEAGAAMMWRVQKEMMARLGFKGDCEG